MTSCPTGYYARGDGICVACISNCDACSDSITCDTCSTGYLIKEGPKTCIVGPTCPTVGYYLNSTISTCK